MKERKFVFEQVDEDGNYVKSEGVERVYYGFWLRFASRHFIPCQKCQERLEKILEESELHLGNKDYEPPIELYKRYEIVDKSWKDIEKRPATEQEKLTLSTGKTMYIEEVEE
jgi:hypothetical protein